MLPQGEQGRLALLGLAAGLGDCLLYEACPAGGVVLNIDGYSERESRYPWLPLWAWAWRSVLASVMDVVATGAEPVLASVSLGVPRWALWEATLAAAEAARYAGAKLGKSDTNRPAPGGWIDVAVLGRLHAPPVPRAPLEPPRGGLLLVQIGYAGYGLVEHLLHGEGREPPPREAMWLAKRKPPVRAWRALADCRPLAAADNSDGLAYTLHAMARLGRLEIRLDRILADPRLPRVAGEPPAEELAQSWEDYNLLVLATPSSAECLCSHPDARPCLVAGSARPGPPRVLHRGRPLPAGGWERPG